jgi:hypothetical protein
MSEMADYKHLNRQELAAAYIDKVGYDPFEDDPTITEAEVAENLAGHDEEEAEAERLYGSHQ